LSQTQRFRPEFTHNIQLVRPLVALRRGPLFIFRAGSNLKMPCKQVSDVRKGVERAYAERKKEGRKVACIRMRREPHFKHYF
jgi:hypothetical protein